MTKSCATDYLDTFKAPEQGYIGGLLSFRPYWYYPAVQPSFKHVFSVSNLTTIPPVAIIYCSQSYDAALIQHAIDDGYQGIIMAGTGAGDIAAVSTPYIKNATAAGIPIVISKPLVQIK